MPKQVVPLTDTKIRNVKAQTKEQKLFDGGGLFLLVTTKGKKLWRMKYTFASKENSLSFGAYPEVTLEMARARRQEVKRQLANSVDPSEAKQRGKESLIDDHQNTFKSVALEWHAYKSKTWSADRSELIERRLINHVFPVIGSKPVKSLDSKKFFSLLDDLHGSGKTFTAQALLGNLHSIMSYAVVRGKCADNPVSVVRDTINLPHTGKSMATLLEPEQIGQLVRDIESYTGTFHVTKALIILSRTFVRPGEIRFARWGHIDLESCWWNIPGDQKKEKRDLSIPLSKQVIKHLKELKKLTGDSEFVFKSPNGGEKPICENVMNHALRRMGYDTQKEITGHGFRAMARTILDEKVGFDDRLVEYQLSHKVKDDLADSYNRSDYREVRASMLQCWSDCLDQMRDGKDYIAYLKKNKQKYKTRTGVLG